MALPALFWLILTVLFGPFVGSFIAVASMRLPAGRPIALERSACDDCGRKLGPFELVPLVSFVALRGRCAGCRGKIGLRHLGFELAGLAIGIWAAIAFTGMSTLLAALLGWQLLLLAALDVEHLWLPRVLTVPLVVSGLLAAALSGADALQARVIGAAVAFALLWGVAFLYRRLRGREGLGGGDAWLFAGGGAWVGWSQLPVVLLIASVSALVFALAPFAFGRPIERDRQLPFGAFLSIGIWIVAAIVRG